MSLTFDIKRQVQLTPLLPSAMGWPPCPTHLTSDLPLALPPGLTFLLLWVLMNVRSSMVRTILLGPFISWPCWIRRLEGRSGEIPHPQGSGFKTGAVHWGHTLGSPIVYVMPARSPSSSTQGSVN